MKVYFKFGGFYDSAHDGLIDAAIAPRYADDTGAVNWDNLPEIDYKHLQEVYAKEYLSVIDDELGTNLQYIGIDRPQYYNYRTDYLLIDISREDINKILQYLREYGHCAGFFAYLRMQKKELLNAGYAFDTVIASSYEFILNYAAPFILDDIFSYEFIEDGMGRLIEAVYNALP